MPVYLEVLMNCWLLLSWMMHSNAQINPRNITTITLASHATHAIPKLYGLMFEDINHSGDGGLLAQLLRNPALQMKAPLTNQAGALEAWEFTGDVKIKAVDLSRAGPLSKAIPNAVEVTVPAGKTGALLNIGYWGIKVDETWVYTASFYAKRAANGDAGCGPKLAVQLVKNGQPGTPFAENVIDGCLSAEWKFFEVKIKPASSASDAGNAFAIKLTSTSTTDEVVHVTLATLVPPTLNARPNGIRMDLAKATGDLKRSRFRWGGNNIEGVSPQDRYFWNDTLGPLKDRTGRIGNWGYINTNFLGLMEVLQFCEDLGMEFINSVWSGLSLNPTKSVPESEIDKYIQEAIDMINFIIGPVSTPSGALRAQLGHPEPFKMIWCEIGNEDFFDKKTYAYRWRHLAVPLKKTFPQLKFIATTAPNDPPLEPKPDAYDIHSYSSASSYVASTHKYDTWPRDGPKVFHMEFAANTKEGKEPLFPTQEGAVAEAAFMTGFERNCDVVEGFSYAPTYCNTQSPEASQWHPNLINYDALQVTLNPSYYVQQMFAQYLGDLYLPSNIPQKPGPVDWSATITSAGDTVFLKITNAGGVPHKVQIVLPFKPTAQVATHTLENSSDPSKGPVTRGIETQSLKTISLVLSAQSVTVMVINKTPEA